MGPPDFNTFEKKETFKTTTNSLGTPGRCNRGEASLAVMTNYVQVNQIPDTLEVYEITDQYTEVGGGVTTKKSLKRRYELERVFNMIKSQDLQGHLTGKVWATDFKHIWVDQELFPPSTTLSY
jgi:hypothetical protein